MVFGDLLLLDLPIVEILVEPLACGMTEGESYIEIGSSGCADVLGEVGTRIWAE